MENKKIEVSSKIGEWYVDFPMNQITWKIDPSVKVPLIDDFFDETSNLYVFAFDLDNRRLCDDPRRTLVKIPQLLDCSEDCRKEFIKHYNLGDIDLTGLNDKEAKMMQPALAERLKIDAVTVDINGVLYRVDHFSNVLAPIEKSELSVLHISDVTDYYDPLTSNCIFLLDKDTGCLTRQLKGDMIAVEIVHPYIMDPVGLSKTHGLDLAKQVMDGRPLKNHYKAKTRIMLAENDNKLRQRNKARKGRHI